MKITFLSDNITENPKCLAEWGLSVYIETGEKKVLFDLGASSMFVRNAKKLRIDLSEADLAVISHGHYDHTGGMEAFAEINHSTGGVVGEEQIPSPYAPDVSQKLRHAVEELLIQIDGAVHIQQEQALLPQLRHDLLSSLRRNASLYKKPC